MSDAMPELQDGEESSHDSDGPSSPGEESPCELKSEEMGERVRSVNCPESSATAVLSSRELWQLFDAIGTEMIVTRRGRRMFPAVKVELYDLKPDVSYILLMDMAPVDKYRYKYNAGWVRCFEEECAPTRLYIHPDSPALGTHWTSIVINFYKLKLTNNQLDKQGHIIVNSMHRYQPRLHIVESEDINSFNWDTRQTFVFPGTQFTTVTAYQNDKITQLKIQTNPFAKGFRTPFSRCRSRNPPGTCARFPLRSGSCSDSGVEDPPHPSPSSLSHSSPTSLFSPRFLLPSHDSSHLLVHRPDSTARLVVQGQDAGPRVLLPAGWDLQQLSVPEQDTQRVLLARPDEKNIILPGQEGKTCIATGKGQGKVTLAGQNCQKLILPAANAQLSLSAQQEAQVTRVMLGQDRQKIILPAQNGQNVLQAGQNILLHQDTQKLILAGQNVQAFYLSGQEPRRVFVLEASEKTQTSVGHSNPEITGKKRRHVEESPVARKVACLSPPPASAAEQTPMVLMYRPAVLASQPPQLVPRALLQPPTCPAASSSTYTIMAASKQTAASSTSQPHVSPSLTTTPLILTSSPHTLPSVPHILSTSHTSPLSTQPSTTTSPTVVNGLLHLKPTEAKPVQVITSSENKKPLMDISCLTREGVVRAQSPPPLLQVQNKKPIQNAGGCASPVKAGHHNTVQLVAHTEEQQQTNQPTRAAEGSRGQELRQKHSQEVVLVQASPPSGMQRVVVIGEKGEPQPQMVLPVAYDQQLISMPIYRVGGSLGGLQPVQVLASLPSGGEGTTA